MNENQWMNPGFDEDFKQEHMMSMIVDAMENFDGTLAHTLLKQYEEEFGQDEFWHLMCVDLDEQKSDPESMLYSIQKAEIFGVDKNELNLRYGRYYYMVGRPEEALEYLHDCQFEPDSDQEFYKTHLEAYCSLIAKDYKTAVGKLEDLLLDSDDYRLLILAGLCYKELGKMGRAEEYVRRALESKDDFLPEYTEALSPYNFKLEEIFAHSDTIFHKLAGSRAGEFPLEPAGIEEMRHAMEMIATGQPIKNEDLLNVMERFGNGDLTTPLALVMQAMQQEIEGRYEQAQDTWHKAIYAPWKHNAILDMLFLYFRFIAMERAGFEEDESASLLWEYWQESQEPMICEQLMEYAFERGIKSVLKKMVLEENRPSFASKMEANHFDISRAKALFELDCFEEGNQVVMSLWPEMEHDTEYLLLASSTAVITNNEELLLKVAERLMPHGVVAFHMLEYYDMEGQPAKCRNVQLQMKNALEDPSETVEEADFYREFLKAFQRRHRR